MTRPQPVPEGVGRCVGSLEAGTLLGVTDRTIRRWTTEGDLQPAYRTRGGHARYRVTDLRALAAKLDADDTARAAR